MSSPEETLSAGRALRCGDSLLVPVVRGTARHTAGRFFQCEATLLGVLELRTGALARFVALASLPLDAPSWSAWLEARPVLLAEIRARLDAAA